MVFVPRDYQEECGTALMQVRAQGLLHALVVMASGLGKTVVAGFDIAAVLQGTPGRVLYLCDRSTHFPKVMRTLQAILGSELSYGYFSGGHKDFDADVLLATFQTMRNHRDQFARDAFVYVVVDESHHAYADTYLPTVLYFKPQFLLGLTATPDRLDMQDIRDVFGEEVYSLPLVEAMARGITAPVDYRLLTDEITHLEVLDTPVGELSIGELNKTLFVPKRDEEIVRSIEGRVAHLDTVRGLVFCETVGHCMRMLELLPGSVVLTSDVTGKKREDLIEAFERGAHRFLITVNVFNEAIDVPSINVLVFLRNTTSVRIFQQQLGRGLRGDETVLVLDFVANCERLVMLRNLREQIQERLLPVPEGGGGVYRDPVTIDWGNIHFAEEVVQIIDVLDQLTKAVPAYTREDIVEAYRQLSLRLGRVPTSVDYARYASYGVVPGVYFKDQHFPGLPDLSRAAGLLPAHRADWTDDEYLREYRNIARRLGRGLKTAELDRASRAGILASKGAITARFGGTASSIARAAGYRPGNVGDWTDEELLEDYVRAAEVKGRGLARREMDTLRDQGLLYASSGYYMIRFKSAVTLARRAGFRPHTPEHWTDEELLEDYTSLAQELGRGLKMVEVSKAYREGRLGASEQLYRKRFDTHAHLARLAGFRPGDPRAWTDKEVLEDLGSAIRKLGDGFRRATYARLAVEQAWLTDVSLINRFGSFNEAVRLARDLMEHESGKGEEG